MDYYGLYALAAQWLPLLKKLEEEHVISRLWQHDKALFPGRALLLDWLNSPEVSLQSLPELYAMKEKVKRGNFSSFVLLGMGGSSLAARVFHQLLGSPKIPFYIVDTIHPSALTRLENQIDIKTTFFIISSKSGGTLEPNLLYHHFVSILEKHGISDTASHFMAITDPVSSLEQLSVENGFLQGPFGSPLIGGRYSALSPFGIMPALLMDIDIQRILLAARQMSNRCRMEAPLCENPGAMLGAFLGLNAINGRDELHCCFSKSLKPFGSWLEQLIAESLGKDNKGIVPILRDEPGDILSQSSMHCFIELSDEIGFHNEKKYFDDNKIPYFTIKVPEKYEIGAEMFRWEIAISVAGFIMEVNPFDQPDVEQSKKAARLIMDNWHGMKQDIASSTSYLNEEGALDELTLASHSAKYCVILSYLDENQENTSYLNSLAQKLEKHLLLPVLVQIGPRYLHSTGQLFKGGPNDGCFLMITGPYDHDFPSDIKGLTFKDIHLSQALGDQEAMKYAGRKLWHLYLNNIYTDIEALKQQL